MEINLATFVNPHFFYVTESDSQHRAAFLRDVSSRIKRCATPSDSCNIDEMVAICYESQLVRATVIEAILDEETSKHLYFCWLVDYAVLIQTDRIFKISNDIKKITPRAKQACLNNICYLKDQLELGVTGKIKKVPTTIPSSGITQYILDVLLSDYTKLVFEEVEHYNNVLIGEIIIYKQGTVIHLTQELCKQGLLATDENIFQRIKYTTTDYLKTHYETIFQLCKCQKILAPKFDSLNTSSSTNEIDDEDEIDIDNSPVIENGRRRRKHPSKSLNSSQNSGSEDDQGQIKQKNKASNLLAMLKKARSSKTLKEEEESTSATIPKDVDNDNISNKTNDDSFNRSAASDISGINNDKHSDISSENNLHQVSDTVKSKHSLESSGAKRPVSKVECLLQKLKQRNSLEGDKKAIEKQDSKVAEDSKSNSDANKHVSEKSWKMIEQLRQRKQRTSSCSTRSEEGFDTSGESDLEDNEKPEKKPDKNSSTEPMTPSSVGPTTTSESESKKSPFSDLTSMRKSKPVGLFVPAGMESRNTSKGAKKTKRKTFLPKTTSSATPDDDCPTIKVPKLSENLTEKLSENLTDDQGSVIETDADSKKEKEEDTSSSELTSKEIFTKQDFCKLVAGCTCVKCRIALEEDDWDAPIRFDSLDGESKKKSQSTGIVIKPPKLLKNEAEGEETVQVNEILSVDYKGMSIMEKKMSCKVLVHGESIPNPIKRVTQVNIHRDIYNNINRLNYKEAKRIQHYAFPAITRNQHVFMVNDAGSGKTMAYLPILISFIVEKNERYSQLLKMGGGPLAVILCSNSKKCEEIYDLTKLILDRQRSRVSLVTYPGYGNISNVDILITMPTILTSLISTRATNFKRMCHFVLEDGDVILKSHYDLVKKFLNYGDQVLEHRNCPKSIQIILCAEHWTPQIEDLLKKLNKVPLVCIGNYLEAALYGKINFTMKFLDTSCKEQNLQRILKDVYKFTKSVIICNPDEVEEIVNFLPLKGIEYMVTTDINEEELTYCETAWNNAIPGKYSVLICTDDIYNTMTITSAQSLVHYSLPRSWTQFIRRFSCLLENNPTPLNIKERQDKVSSFVFIDENCEPRMSKFCNFIKIAGLEKDLPEKIKTFFKGVALEEEYRKVARKIELCETLKIYGKCDSLHCKKRHVLDKNLDDSEILPKNGSIKFKIVKMTNATTCSIKLMESFDLKGQSVKKFEDFTEFITDTLAKSNVYQSVSKPIENHLYLHKEGESYCRCRVVEMDEHVLVYLIDKGIYCQSDLNRLFRMPPDLKKIPQQSYEAHIANLIPPHDDMNFSRSAKHKAQFLIDSNCPNSVMTATIVLQLGNNLWVDDVCEEREMHDKSLPTIGYQLSRELVKQELAIKITKPLSHLYSLCKNADIELPNYKLEKPKIKKVVVEQVKPQWAHLDMDDLNQVQFSCAVSPGEFYVKHQKFTRELFQLEEDIQREICKPFYPVPQKIEVGKCYLVKDDYSGNYARGLVLSIEDDHALVFCVDYGDDFLVPTSSLKHISNELITKLPFQSIQCTMYGIVPIEDCWSLEARDLLYKVGFEEGSTIFRTLFAKTCCKQKNVIIPDQHSYSVIIKDGFNERHVLWNELLIDCGFAIPNGDEIKDFELPEEIGESEDELIEEISREESISVEVEDEYSRDSFDLDAFDVEIYDVAEFVKELNLPIKKVDSSRALEERKTEDCDLPPIKAAPAVDYLTPEVYWSQTESTVKMTIKVCDVRDPKIILMQNRIFRFDYDNNGKKYHLNLILYEKVKKTFQYTALGPEVRVTLTKCKQEEWPRLPYTKDKVKKIHYDFSSMKDDEKPRKLLQLDISDSSSEGDENDGMVYHVCSDLDDEYDYDIPNDDQ